MKKAEYFDSNNPLIDYIRNKSIINSVAFIYMKR